MSKFVINCPVCGKPVQASTGAFAKKEIKCSCGYVIDVNSNKLATKVCPHCGETVTYDRANEKNATCPNCHGKLFSSETIKFTCPTCHKELTASAGAKTFVCPQCHSTIDVQARYAQEQSAGKTSVIKWDMGKNNVFIYRHPVERFNIGSQLIVAEGQKAIFFRDGRGLDIFSPGRYTLETQRLPLMDELYKLPSGVSGTFDSRVYFIRTNRLKINWGVPKLTLIDKTFGFHIDLGCSGTFEAQIIDDNESPRKLLYMIMNSTSGEEDDNVLGGEESYSSDYIAAKFKEYIVTNIQDLLSNILVENSINFLDVDLKKNIIEDLLRQRLNERILIEYGMFIPKNFFAMPNLRIQNQEEVNKWRKQEADRVLKVREEEVLRAEAEAAQGRKFVEGRTEAGLHIIESEGEAESVKILAEGEAEKIRVTGSAEAAAYSAQAAAEAEEMRAKGFTYREETARVVGTEAMKNGLPGTGTGGKGGGSSIVGDLVGLGIAVGATKEILGEVKEGILSPSGSKGPAEDPSLVPAWDCDCGTKCITSKFCPNCGKPMPVTDSSKWDCECGKKGITSKFCPNCGKPRPVAPETWDCPNCGTKGITSNFCPNCGKKKGE